VGNDLLDLRSLPGLVAGVTGHRRIAFEDPASTAISDTLQYLLQRLNDELTAVSANPVLFSPNASALRIIGMAAQGADLLAMRAAHRLKFPIACALPFLVDEYRKDFKDSSFRNLFEEVLRESESIIELPGTREEGARSYERANEVILSNSSMIIAVWDGMRARGVAGTGDMVQMAFERGMPTIVIDPKSPRDPSLLMRPKDDPARFLQAVDAVREKIPDSFSDLFRRLLNPRAQTGSGAP
jgi:hypothetical protein